MVYKSMPRRLSARETEARELQREIEIAEELCRQEEAEISDAVTLNSDSDADYQPSESSSDGSYESDFIDDSDAPPMSKWKPFDMRRIEDHKAYLKALAKQLQDHTNENSPPCQEKINKERMRARTRGSEKKKQRTGSACS